MDKLKDKKVLIIISIIVLLFCGCIVTSDTETDDLKDSFERGKEDANSVTNEVTPTIFNEFPFSEEDTREYFIFVMTPDFYPGNKVNVIEFTNGVVTIDLTFDSEYGVETAKWDIEGMMERLFRDYTDVTEATITSNVFNLEVNTKSYQNFEEKYSPGELDINKYIELMRKK